MVTTRNKRAAESSNTSSKRIRQATSHHPTHKTTNPLVQARTYGSSAGARRFRTLDSSVLSSGSWARALSPDDNAASSEEPEASSSAHQVRPTTRRKAAVKAKAHLSDSLVDSLPLQSRRRRVSLGSSPSPDGAPPSIFDGSHSPSLSGTPRTSPMAATPQREPLQRVRQSVLSEETLRALREAAGGDQGEEEHHHHHHESTLGALAPLSGSSLEGDRVAARLPRALRALRPMRNIIDKGKGKATNNSTPSFVLHSPQRSTARTPADSASIHERPRSSMKPWSTRSDYTAGREALVIVDLASQGLPRQETLLFSSSSSAPRRRGAQDDDEEEEDDLPRVDELNYVTPLAPDSSDEQQAQPESSGAAHQQGVSSSSAESSPASPLRAVKLRSKLLQHPPSSPPLRAFRARTRSLADGIVAGPDVHVSENVKPVYKLSTKARLPATSYYARAKREEGSPTPALLPSTDKAALLTI